MSAPDRTDTLLPSSTEAERSVLCAVLLDNGALHRAQELLTVEDFYRERHRKIWGAMEILSERRAPIDLVTLREELHRTNDLEPAGGPAYLATLVSGMPRTAHVGHYAEIVKQKAITRRLAESASRIHRDAIADEQDPESLLDAAEKAIFEIAGQRIKKGLVPMRPIAEEALTQIEDYAERKDVITGIPTGFERLDELTAGLQPSDLIIVAGRPSMGKTAFCLNVAQNAAAHHGRSAAIFSLEMDRRQLFLRMLCAEARLDTKRVRTGQLPDEDWQRLMRAFTTLVETNIWIDDSSGLGVLEMRAKARRLKADQGLDLVVVDYLQLMRGHGRYESRQQEISDISRSLKELAKELEVPVVALSQLSRAPEQRTGSALHRPQLSDLRDSGAIEQDADVVMFIYRPELYRPDDPELEGKAEVIVGKNSNGPVGLVKLAFLSRFTRFENLDDRVEF
jgi:replicative DNA helicase